MKELKDYECDGQISILDYLDHSPISKVSASEPLQAEEETLIFQVIDDKVKPFHVMHVDGDIYHCKEGDIHIPQTAFGKDFFHFGIAAQKQAIKNSKEKSIFKSSP